MKATIRKEAIFFDSMDEIRNLLYSKREWSYKEGMQKGLEFIIQSLSSVEDCFNNSDTSGAVDLEEEKQILELYIEGKEKRFNNVKENKDYFKGYIDGMREGLGVLERNLY